MRLSQYLKEQGITRAAFADDIKMSRDIVYRWLRKDCHPTHDVAKKIVRATKGKVTMADIYQ